MLNSNTIGDNLSRATAAIKVYFWQLFGMSLLYNLISYGFSRLFGDSRILAFIVSIFVLFPMSAGIYFCHLKAIRGQKIGLSDLFAAFRDGSFLRVFGGMLWLLLWVTLWALVPIMLFVFAAFGSLFGVMGMPILWLSMIIMIAVILCKFLQYSFTPLILLDHPEVSATDALKVSMRYTSGLKGRLFGTILIFAAIEAAVALAVWVLFWILFLTSGAIITTSITVFIGANVFVAVFGVFCQLTYASFYNNADAAFCPYRGFAQSANPWVTSGYRDMHQKNRSDVPPVLPQNDRHDGEL